MIDKDVERGEIVVDAEKSHIRARRTPVGHEQPSNSGVSEGGNKAVPRGKIGDDGAMQRLRRAQERRNAAVGQRKVAQPDGIQLERNLAGRSAFGLLRGAVASASSGSPRRCAVIDDAVSTADAAASAGQKNAA